MPKVLDDQLTTMRGELVGFAYRMLGSPFEAEDAAQETLLRAWRHGDSYDPGRASLRTWVYRIATNVCLDMLRSAQRRSRATDFTCDGDFGPPLPESTWVLPLLGDPPAEAERRETIRLAFVAALQHLPPRQRAVLILRDVLCWPAVEVAALLDASVPSVTSALQRARATLRAASPGSATSLSDSAQRALVDRYADAFQRHDIPELVSLLQEDVTTAMPPFAWWLRGRETVGAVMAASDACLEDRMVPVRANGGPALWQLRPASPGGAPEPFGLLVFDFGDSLISGVTTFLGFQEVRVG
ncbi:RNA polymerase subunit sigma-70 [Actinoplanes sp. TBRC 11911]|uniref:RNA polymerase subunit sigma-70 n=1 Tax=Actinoplanes sp. TBRC 11911 TaxID=2729386 RepID=UPI00145FCFA0|nr:RNA polymerase subunit sigma-70 [Actinoplanes sp. TBRC 11911]NMO53522.1 RNA polymerase subunit sigma-70 [Actinoplanes sp. TBRC 11911]